MMNDTYAFHMYFAWYILQQDENKTDIFSIDLIFQTTAKPYSGTGFLRYATK